MAVACPVHVKRARHRQEVESRDYESDIRISGASLVCRANQDQVRKPCRETADWQGLRGLSAFLPMQAALVGSHAGIRGAAFPRLLVLPIQSAGSPPHSYNAGGYPGCR